MSDEIFRKESLEKVKSPESLNDYIQVSNPSVWLLIISIIVLLAGACVWGAIGRIDSTVDANIIAEDGVLTAYVKYDKDLEIYDGMIVKFDGLEVPISDVVLHEDTYICSLQTTESVRNGFYDGSLVVKSINPLSFIFN